MFIGGMDGVEEEAALFRAYNPGPMFAIGSTGSAADVLLDRREDVTGRSMTTQALRQTLSYPLVMEQMFADLDLLGDAQRR